MAKTLVLVACFIFLGLVYVSATAATVAEDIVRMYDKNGDGKLNADEISGFMCQSLTAETLQACRNYVTTHFTTVDTDNDGFATAAELVAAGSVTEGGK